MSEEFRCEYCDAYGTQGCPTHKTVNYKVEVKKVYPDAMVTHLIETQYVDSKGNPTTEWEPVGHSPLRDGKINDSHQGLIDANPHKDGLGRTLPNGEASYRYNYRHVAYQRIKPNAALSKAPQVTITTELSNLKEENIRLKEQNIKLQNRVSAFVSRFPDGFMKES